MDDGPAPAEGLNLKQVAATLGVHYMTAYRYVRTGRLHATKLGTAWVVHPDSLADFRAADQAVRAAIGSAGGPTRGEVPWATRLATALVKGDETAAWRVIEQALASGHSPADCYLKILTGALLEISDPTVSGDSSAEFIATATATRLAARLGGRFRRPGRSRGTVVFGAPVGERHTLPIAIVADLVRMEGFTCLELGANVPAGAFADAATRARRLVAVGIGVTTATNIAALQTTIAAVRAVAPTVPVLLGGQAVRNPEIAALHGATHWAADGAQAVALIADLPAPRRAAESAR